MADKDRMAMLAGARWLVLAILAVVAVAGGLGLGVGLAGTSAHGTAAPNGTGASQATQDAAGSHVPSASVDASPSPTPLPTPDLVAAPLTGVLVPRASASFRPIAVMVDDHRAARPQSGFNAASVVWQAPAEGGIPRYMLVFQETIPSTVGPIRSAREYYIDWASEWDALFVHVGGSPQALSSLRRGGDGSVVWNVDEPQYGTRAMWRITQRVAPHNAYTDGAHLRSLAASIGAADTSLTAAWAFGPDRPVASRPDASTLSVTYPYETVTYRYDPATNTYHRFIDGAKQPQVDAADGLVVAPKNVLILRMRFGPLNDGNPEKGRLEASDTGTGEAWVATNGRTIRAVWRKDSPTSPTAIETTDGRPIRLTAGQTFVQVIALSYPFSVDDSADAARRGGPTR